MQVTLHHPLEGFYRGTRFDRSGLFKSLLLDGTELCGDWFEHYSPTLHDAVRGPAEEFSLMSFEGLWLKIGVGLLRPTEAPYDRFRLYDIAVPGRWEMDGMRFKHYLEGCYDYTKELVITGPKTPGGKEPVKLNGEEIKGPYITHGQVMGGGSLAF